MKSKPNIDSFLNAAAGEISNKAHIQEINKTHKEQKIFRLSIELIKRLKREAYERSIEEGNRITETEIVESALWQYFDTR